MKQPKVSVLVIICLFFIAKSTMVDLDEKYRPDSDDNDVVVAVKTNAEEGGRIINLKIDKSQ